MMKMLTLLVMIVSVKLGAVVAQCSDGDVRLQQADTSDLSRVSGVVQLCTGGEWRTACRSISLTGYWYHQWNAHAASLVCKQLGYSSEDSASNHICSRSVSKYIQEIDCGRTNNILQNCCFQNGDSCTGYSCSSSEKRHAAVSCQRVDCTNGEIRLVGGSTNREGRVEVCMDGRWGTVCNNSQEGIAGAVCSQLGYPAQGSFLRTYPPGSLPMHNCTFNEATRLSCTLTDCDHSRVLGVLCLSQEEINQVTNRNNPPTDCPETPCSCEDTPCPTTVSAPTIEVTHTTTTPQIRPCTEDTACPTCEPTREVITDDTNTPCNCEDTPCLTEPLESTSETITSSSNNNCPPCTTLASKSVSDLSKQEINTTTTSGSYGDNDGCGCATAKAEDLQQTVSESENSCVSTPVLGGVVGVLVTVLVVLVIGWSLSCVALVKRNSHTPKQTQFMGSSNNESSTQRQLDNPVYDTNMETHDYSSSGPTYELVDTNEGAGQTYSVLEQCQESNNNQLKTTTEDEECNYHVLGSEESEGVTGGACDYEVPVSGQTHSRVKLCEEEYSTLHH